MSAENVHAIVEFGSSYQGVETFEVTPLSAEPSDTAGDELARAALRLKTFHESLDSYHAQILSAVATTGLPHKTICHNYGLTASQLTRLLQKWQGMLGLQNSTQLVGFWRMWSDRTGAEPTQLAPTVLRRLDTVVRNNLAAARPSVDSSALSSLTPVGRFDLLSPSLWIEYLRAIDRLEDGQGVVDQLSRKRLTQHRMFAGLFGFGRPPAAADAAWALDESTAEDIYFFLAMHLSYLGGRSSVSDWSLPRNIEHFFAKHRGDAYSMEVLYHEEVRAFVRQRPPLFRQRSPAEGYTARVCSSVLFSDRYGDSLDERLKEAVTGLHFGGGLEADAGLFALAFPEYTDFSSHVLQKRLEYIAQQRFSPRDLDRAWGLLSLGYEFGDQDLASGRNR